MSNCVLVLDDAQRQLKSVHAAVARRMLKAGQVAVFRRQFFTLICRPGVSTRTAAVRLKIDLGSKITGLALLLGNRAIWAGELIHRGQTIKASLESRRALRRGRRNRNTRYRKPRFDNRTKPKGWLPPALRHRVETTLTWVQCLARFTPVSALSVERVRFDIQLIRSPGTQGVEDQQGALWQQEVRAFVFTRTGYQCAYCGAKQVPLEIEHIVPRSKGGSNAPPNLTAACVACNQKKGNLDSDVFLANQPDVRRRIKAQLKSSLKDAAAVNPTRHFGLSSSQRRSQLKLG